MQCRILSNKQSFISFFLKLTIVFFVAGSIASFKAYSNPGLIYLSFEDSSGTDTISKISSGNLMADSSKMFSSLISASTNNNKAFNLSLNAEARFFVDDYIKKHTAYYNNMKVWGKPYFALYDRILSSYGIPIQLKYLSVIESSLSNRAVSWAGAAGPWQIMSDAAHEHGLRTGYYGDDRLDYIKSTNAACKILKELFDTYGDWLLVIAAYNSGSGTVNRAITKAHSKSFWDIQYQLPLETRNHVKKFIATHYFFEGDGSIATLTGDEAKSFITDNNIPKNDPYAGIAANSATINVYGKYNSVVIANTLMMDISIFNQLNPDFDNVLAKGEIYPLRIPSDKVQLFQSKKIEMLKRSVELLLNASSAAVTSGK